MSKFGRFNAGKDIGPPSPGDQHSDWKRANYIRGTEDAMKKVAAEEIGFRNAGDTPLAEEAHIAMQRLAERAMSQRRFGRLKDAISGLGDKYGATVKERK